jgi:hypothetical protein
VNTLLKILIPAIFIFLISCSQPRVNFDRGIIPPEATNFSGVNSSYDDYNSEIITSTWESSFSLVFSTNRYSYGENFDFNLYECYFQFDLINAGFNIYAYNTEYFLEENSLFDSVNSPANELGPYLTYDLFSHFNSISDKSDKRFFYTSDINGNNDIFCIYYSIDSYSYKPAGNPINLSGINTVSDEGYLTIHPDENTNRETVYFASNRDDGFDIYRALSEENKLIDQSAILEISKAEQLSSDSDDKCPFITGDIMAFASDRNGGFGGYDLWYSTYKDNEWSLPVNFGQDINTEYDEFRPVIMVTNPDEFLNNLMIFSSNRPGGAGRFDLYYVGVSKTINGHEQ